MMNHHTPEFYREQLITLKANPDPVVIEESIFEIEDILKGMEKGIKILKTHGGKADPQVLENQKHFQELLSAYQKLI